jgi:hypothetical protein
LAETGIGGGVFCICVRPVRFTDANVEIVSSAEIILGSGAADGRKLAVTVDEELNLSFPPPTGVIAAPGHIGADIVTLAHYAIDHDVVGLVGQRVGSPEACVEIGGVERNVDYGVDV